MDYWLLEQRQKDALQRQEHRQKDSLQRLERSAELTRERQEENDARKERQKTQAVIMEGANAKELMNLQHQLNKENRQLDHQFNMAEDARELEKEATELIMRRRDDFIRHHWSMDQEILGLELRILESQIKAQSDSKLSKQEHEQNKDFETHKSKLEKDVFAFKEKYSAEMKIFAENIEVETISKHLSGLFKKGKLPK